MKISIDKVIVTIIYLGFTAVTSIASLQDLQTDAVAHKGLRLASILIALYLSFIVFSLHNPLRYLQSKHLFTFFLYFCSVSITTLWSGVPTLTAFKSLELLLLVLLGLISISSKKTDPYALFDWVLLLFILQITIIWIEALIFPDLAFKQIRGTTPFLSGMLRGVYPTMNPNTVGFIGGVVVVTLLPKLLDSSKLMRLENVFFVLAVMTVIASYSRGALLSTGVVIILYAFFTNNRKVLFSLVAVLAVLVLSGKHHVIIAHLERGKEAVDLATFSSGRTDIWQAALDNYSQLIFGQGYAVAFRLNRFLGNTNAHNSIIEILTGAGIAGVIFWLNIYFRLFLTFYYNTKLYSETKHFIIINALLYLFLSSFTNARGVYLDHSMLLIISITVYADKNNLFLRTRQS